MKFIFSYSWFYYLISCQRPNHDQKLHCWLCCFFLIICIQKILAKCYFLSYKTSQTDRGMSSIRNAFFWGVNNSRSWRASGRRFFTTKSIFVGKLHISFFFFKKEFKITGYACVWCPSMMTMIPTPLWCLLITAIRKGSMFVELLRIVCGYIYL